MTPWTVREIFQARILVWVAFPFSRGFSQPRNEPRSPALQADSLPAKLQGKPKNTGVGRLSLLQRIFLTQESNQVSWIAGRFFTNCTMTEALYVLKILIFYTRLWNHREVKMGDQLRKSHISLSYSWFWLITWMLLERQS